LAVLCFIFGIVVPSLAAELIEQKKKKDMLDFKQDDYVSAIKYSIVFGILQYAALLIFGYAAFLL
jgi:hypothetical protein